MIHHIFPDAYISVNPMIALASIDTDASKHEKNQISRATQVVFEEADFWLTEA
ncbi:DinI-like family protein [Klebsiella oxytoca]|uniref:DinI-like family protein n=1 Tax=Klebsiella oxytoca TaxID=571 RepID=A0A6B8MUI0_KLEOX|nr:DinI-like family protein [Klebsiella oxytoca]